MLFQKPYCAKERGVIDSRSRSGGKGVAGAMASFRYKVRGLGHREMDTAQSNPMNQTQRFGVAYGSYGMPPASRRRLWPPRSSHRKTVAKAGQHYAARPTERIQLGDLLKCAPLPDRGQTVGSEYTTEAVFLGLDSLTWNGQPLGRRDYSSSSSSSSFSKSVCTTSISLLSRSSSSTGTNSSVSSSSADWTTFMM